MMLSKSLVLLLRPETEQDLELLMELYKRFKAVIFILAVAFDVIGRRK